MTYRDLWHRASILCDKGEITLGEYEEMTKPLDREVEQEPRKGHWDKDGACPFCGYFQQWKDDAFCGHCGAQLGEVEE